MNQCVKLVRGLYHVILLTIWLSGSLFGQLSEEIDTIVISGSQIPLKISETGRNVTVIQADAIARMPAVSIDEILQLVPGVEVQSRNGFGAQADILMRGSTFAQVLVLVDGMRLNDPLTAHMNANIPVVNSDIERIEVLRGPAAAMYGPDAVGGLINIVTKTFDSRGPDGFHGNAELGLGSNEQRTAKAGLTYRGDHVMGSLGVQINKAAGELIPSVLTPTSELEPYRNYFDIRTIGGSVAFKLGNGMRLKVRSSYDFRDFSARYFYTASTFDKSTEISTNSFNVVKLEKVRDRSISDLQVGFKLNTDEFEFSPDFASTNEHTTKFLNLMANHMWSASEMLTIKMGAQIDHRSIVSSDRGDHEDWHAGFYGMTSWQSNEGLNLSGSLRADYDANYDLEILPQVNASYVLDKVVFRGAIGRSIRAADYTERYVSHNLSNLTPLRNLGNPDLMAESSWSEEIGIDIFLGPHWQLKSTGFLRQSSQLIDYALTNESEIGNIGNLQTGEDYFFAKNVTSVSTRGIEFESTFRKKFGQNNMASFMFGYTHQTTSNKEDIVSVYIANHAKDLVTLSSIFRFGSFDFALGGLYKNRNGRFSESISSELDPSYMLWNLKSGYSFGAIDLSFQIQNLFNADYQNILGAPMPHRWLSGSVGWQF